MFTQVVFFVAVFILCEQVLARGRRVLGKVISELVSLSVKTRGHMGEPLS